MSHLPPLMNVVAPSPGPSATTRQPRRWVIFLAVFLSSLMLGLVYIWSRAAIYESRATLLTTAPIVIDQSTRNDSAAQIVIHDERNATPQDVILQQRILLGTTLLEDVLKRLRGAGMAADLTVSALQSMLTVMPLHASNLVELRAQGTNEALLPAVIDTWIDAYQAMRTREASATRAQTIQALHRESDELADKIEHQREALAQFRRAHGILSLENADDQRLARRREFAESFDRLNDEALKAKARLDAARAAIAHGEPVVPPQERASLSHLQQRAQTLREKLTELRRRYTNQYIALQPQLRSIQEQLEVTEQEIAEKIAQGAKNELAEAERAYQAAHGALQALQAQFEAHEREMAESTNRLAQHQAMQKELTDSEALYRKVQEQLLRLEVEPRQALPLLSVVSPASPPGAPIWPDYRQDSAIALALSLMLGLVSIWLYEFLTASRRVHDARTLSFPNIQVYSVPENLLRDRAATVGLLEPQRAALEQLPPRELSEAQLRTLMDSASLPARQLIGVLLSGLSLTEAQALRAAHLDCERHLIRVPGAAPRCLPLAPRLHTLFCAHTPPPAWGTCDLEDLQGLLTCAAIDAGLDYSHGIEAQDLRHTYLAYLVRQGIRLAELERVAGPLPGKVLAAYGSLSPPGPGLPATAVDLIHPVLRENEASA